MEGRRNFPRIFRRSGETKLLNLSFEAACHVSHAIVKMTSSWLADAGAEAGGTLVLPIDAGASVTHVSVSQGKRYFTTLVVESAGYSDVNPNAHGDHDECKGNSDDLRSYKLPLISILANERLLVEVSWVQPLDFSEGHYWLTLPTAVPHDMIHASAAGSGQSVCGVTCSLNTGVAMPVNYRLPYHAHCMHIVGAALSAGQTRLVSNPMSFPMEHSFQVGYQMWDKAISHPSPCSLHLLDGMMRGAPYALPSRLHIRQARRHFGAPSSFSWM